MAFDFKFADPGEGITEGEIVAWLVEEGDTVAEHQGIIEIETDKAVVEIPTPKAGVVLKLNAQEGDTIQVGDILVIIGEAGESVEPAEDKKDVSGGTKTVSTLVGELTESDEVFEVVLAAPATRRLAKDLLVNLKEVTGSGSGGRITEADVRKYAALSGVDKSGVNVNEDAYGPIEFIPVRGIRKATAKKMIKAFSTIPHVCHMDEADITDLFEFRNSVKDKMKEDKGVKLTLMPFLIKGVVDALQKFPYFNSVYDGDTEEIKLKKYYNISIAVDTDRGLLTPVVKNAGKKGSIEIAADIEQLIKKVNSKEISLAELKGGSFTITNVGALGGIYSTPIINYPEVAILATGKVRDRPLIEDGKIVVKKIIPLSLSFDHRVVDGADAVRFTNLIINRLEDISWIDRGLFE